jgi:hypothetical protein
MLGLHLSSEHLSTLLIRQRLAGFRPSGRRGALVKHAKIAAAKAAPTILSYDPAYCDPVRRARAEQLLLSYPDVTEDEREEIVSFLFTGMHLDVGLVSGDSRLRDKVAAIRAAHPDRHQAGSSFALFLIAMFVVVLALMCWLAAAVGS